MTHIQRVVTHGCLRLSTQHIKETRRNLRMLRLRELVTLDDFLSTKRILVFSQNLNARGFLFTEDGECGKNQAREDTFHTNDISTSKNC